MMKIGIRKGGKYATGAVPDMGAMPSIGIRPGGAYQGGVVPSDPSVMGFLRDRAQTVISALTPSPSAPNPVVSAVTENTGLTGNAASAMQSRNKANEEALNLKDGAAKLDGPGTTTSDSIPAHLSKGEAVLPAKTVQAVGAGNIANLIAQTNVPPKVGVRSGGRYANGAVPKPEDDAAYKAGQATREAAANVAKPIENAATVAALPFKIGAGLAEKGVQAAGQFGRGAFGMAPAGATAPAEVTPLTAADHARAAASAEQARRDAGVAPVAAPAATVATAPPAAPAAAAPIGVRRPAQPAPSDALPQFGTSGTGFVRNESTGATQIVNAPSPQAASPQVTPFRNAAGYDPQLDRIAATNAATVKNIEAQAALHGAQTTEEQQKAATQRQALDIQAEMANPNISDKRKAQLSEILHGLRGAGDVWMPYQAKDSMGMPTGESLMYNRATGETKPVGAPPAAAPAAIPATGEVRGGYKFKGGNPNDKANWEKV